MAEISEKNIIDLEYFNNTWDGMLCAHLGVKDRAEFDSAVSVYMSPLEKAAVFVNGFMQDFTASASSIRRAKLIIGRNEIRMRALVHTFGVATLEDKLPCVARNQKFADMARDLGGNKLAVLIEHSLR